MSVHVAAVAALLLASFTLGKDDFNSKLVISEVSRKIDLSTQLAKVSTSLTIENGGDSATGYFHLAIEPSLVDKLAFVGVTVSISFCNLTSHRDQKLRDCDCVSRIFCLQTVLVVRHVRMERNWS